MEALKRLGLLNLLNAQPGNGVVDVRLCNVVKWLIFLSVVLYSSVINCQLSCFGFFYRCIVNLSFECIRNLY